MKADAIRSRTVFLSMAAVALLLMALAVSFSLQLVYSHESSPQQTLAYELVLPPAPERLPHPEMVPPERPMPAQNSSSQQTPAPTPESIPGPGQTPSLSLAVSGLSFQEGE